MIHPAALQKQDSSKSFDPAARNYPGFSREHEFLLHLMGRPSPEQSLALEQAAPRVDWQHLFAISSPDLWAYIGYKINEHGFRQQCPPRLWREAGDARRATAAQWLRLRCQLRSLLGEFALHQVDCVVLKGAVLAFIAYPDSSLRSVSDIDLLLHPESLGKALELIDKAGFRCPKRFRFAHPVIVKHSVVPGEEISLPLEKPGTRDRIEVHTQLESAEPWFPVPSGTVWERTEEIAWSDLRVRILDPHEFLFHLVLHLARGHFFSLGLRPLLDVHLWVALQRKRLDWEWIVRECVRRGYADWMYITLKMVSEAFRTPIPRYFFDHIARPAELDRLESLAYEQIWADQRAISMVPPRLAITLSQPSVGRAISSLFRRIDPGGSTDNPTIPALTPSKNSRWLGNLRRILFDLKVKAPEYARAWWNGSLRWSSLRRAACLERGREEIKGILLGRRRG